VLKAVKKKIKLLAKFERKLRDAWSIEHDNAKKKRLEKRALELTRRLDKLQDFADGIFKG
jgi:DNA repair photolyase